MAEEDAEDVEGEVAIVCKGKRVDKGVVVCDRQHDSYDKDTYNRSRKTTSDGLEA